jgi:hypothetical protein
MKQQASAQFVKWIWRKLPWQKQTQPVTRTKQTVGRANPASIDRIRRKINFEIND